MGWYLLDELDPMVVVVVVVRATVAVMIAEGGVESVGIGRSFDWPLAGLGGNPR